MKKLFIISLVCLAALASLFAFAANKYYNFTQSEMEALKEALVRSAQLEADIAELEEYIKNPTYDKVSARAALSDISESALELSKAFDIVNAKLTGEGVSYVLNLSNRKYHLSTCDSANTIKHSLYFTGTYEELENMGYEPCKTCNPSGLK